jgi:HEAT repeat protein
VSESPCDQLHDLLAGPVLGQADLPGRLDALDGVEECIEAGLETALEASDWGWFERYVLAATRHPSASFVPFLSQVLRLHSDQVNNEDIVTALGETGDPRAVDCLVEALRWRPDWDEFHGLAVKAVWALGRIGSPDAIAALGDVAVTGPDKVREAARSQLAAAEYNL